MFLILRCFDIFKKVVQDNSFFIKKFYLTNFTVLSGEYGKDWLLFIKKEY